jgi:signal transduction histidine kinase
MPERSLTIFLLLTSLIVLVFIAGIVLFILQYRKGKIANEKEKSIMKEQHQKELLQTQLDIQRQTMLHIGTEIHDNVGQKLTLASLYAKQLAIGTGKNMENKMAEVGSIIDESLTELRQLSKTLTNPELASADIISLLKEDAKRINVSGICHVSIHAGAGEIILPQADKNILFRLLQEFMQNSLKHSGCRKIEIILEKEGEKLLIKAMDDGKGFDTTVTSTGIGLQNIKRRAGQLNALYQLSSEAGRGTTLSLQLTLTK